MSHTTNYFFLDIVHGLIKKKNTIFRKPALLFCLKTDADPISETSRLRKNQTKKGRTGIVSHHATLTCFGMTLPSSTNAPQA